MATINLAPGEKQKIISQPNQGDAYNINVDGGEVFLSHRSNGIVREGKRVKKGDRTVASNLRGKPVYAKNPAGNSNNARLEVDRAGFALSFQARAVVGAVDTARTDTDAPAASDDWDEATGSAVDIGSGGSTTEVLTPPGRADQVMLRVEGSAAFEVSVTWNNTSETYSSSSGVVDEVVPVYYISDDVDIQVSDTSGGANTVDYDMVVV